MTITVTGLEEIQRRLGKNLRPAIRRAARAIGEVVREKLAKYPPRRHGAKVKFTSAKQRGAFFAGLREGEIEVPYRRGKSPSSQDLGPSWTVQPKGDGAVVGTRVTYAPWVQGAESQTAMHRATGWVTDVQVAEDVAKSGQVERIVEDAVVGELTG